MLAGCAWEPRCVTLMTKGSVNASPAQSALSLSSSSVCLLACRSEHTHWLAPSAVTLHLHLIFNHRARFQCTDFTRMLSVSLPALAIGHSLHTPLSEPFKTQRCCRLALGRSWNQIPEAVRFFRKRVQLTVISGLLDLSLLILISCYSCPFFS